MSYGPSYLPPRVDQALQTMTRYVSRPLGFNKVYSGDSNKREVEYASSLPLQVVLYFNVYYSIVWLIGCSFMWPVLISRSDSSNRVWIILILFAFILMVIFEIIRLYLAYIGNLCERVPELTGFWLLTLIIEVPLCIFIMAIVWIPIANVQTSQSLQIARLLPLQFGLEAVHTLFVLFEAVFGFFALRLLARQQIARFHYKQFDKSNVTGGADPADHEDNSYGYSKFKSSADWLNNLEKTQNFQMNTLPKSDGKYDDLNKTK